MLKDCKRILIFNVNWLGDVLFSTAAIRNLRYSFPEAFIACVIPPRCYPILKGNVYLDEIIIFDEKDRHRGLWGKIRFAGQLKKMKFDAVFLLHRSMSRALICFLAGIPQRIGYSTKKRAFLLTKKIPAVDPFEMHRIDYYLNVISGAGIRVEDRFLDFFLAEDDKEFVENYLRQNIKLDKKNLLVGMHPGGNWNSKRWPKEYWATLADLLKEHLQAEVFFTGSKDDLPLIEEILQLTLQKPKIVAGLFNLKQFGAFCKRLDLFISADSGPLHIARAVEVKSLIAIFGPTSPFITGPLPSPRVAVMQKDIGCKIPCYELNCADNRCMKAITPQEVLEKIRTIIDAKD